MRRKAYAAGGHICAHLSPSILNNLLPSALSEEKDGNSGCERRMRVGGRRQGQALLLISQGGTEEDLKAHKLFTLFLTLSLWENSPRA